jgi:hypothetical protein
VLGILLFSSVPDGIVHSHPLLVSFLFCFVHSIESNLDDPTPGQFVSGSWIKRYKNVEFVPFSPFLSNLDFLQFLPTVQLDSSSLLSLFHSIQSNPTNQPTTNDPMDARKKIEKETAILF